MDVGINNYLKRIASELLIDLILVDSKGSVKLFGFAGYVHLEAEKAIIAIHLRKFELEFTT